MNIRLRSPQNRSVFLPYESILHTLLHELCHNAIGPHNDQFYKLLDEVMKESENLISSNGFDLVSAGMKLSNDRRNPDVVDRRRVTAAAAEKRLQRKALFKSGRLGGGEDGIHLVSKQNPTRTHSPRMILLIGSWHLYTLPFLLPLCRSSTRAKWRSMQCTVVFTTTNGAETVQTSPKPRWKRTETRTEQNHMTLSSFPTTTTITSSKHTLELQRLKLGETDFSFFTHLVTAKEQNHYTDHKNTNCTDD